MKPWILATSFAAPLALGALSMAPGCVPTEDDPLACRDGSCAHQGTKTFCDIDGVYPSAEAPNECIEPPADDACNRAVACTNPDTPYCNDDSMGTCVECTDNTHCTEEGESCDTRTGECTDEPVFTCEPGTAGDAECAARNNGLDYCADAEICVACITNDHCIGNAAGEVCDQTLLECRTCQGPQDCESGICGAVTEGLCVPVDDIVYVDAAAPANAGCGVEAQPCNTIQKGLDITTAQRNVVRVASGNYPELLTIDTGTVAIVGAGASPAVITPDLSAGQSAVAVSNGAELTLSSMVVDTGADADNTDAVICTQDSVLTLADSIVRDAERHGIDSENCQLTLRGATVTGNSGIGITATGGTVDIQDSTIQGNAGIGISATGGAVDIQRSTIASNGGGGVSITSAEYNITNSIIVTNGSDGPGGSDRGGVFLSSATPGTFEFNTLSGNAVRNGEIVGSGLTCSGAPVAVANNIVVADGQGGGQGLIVGGCNLSYTLTDDKTPAAGTGNIVGQPDFVDPAMVDYRLQADSPGVDQADPAATLDVDRFGNPRPVGDARDMGAHEVQ